MEHHASTVELRRTSVPLPAHVRPTRHASLLAMEPELIPAPGLKVKLAPHGVLEIPQFFLAVEVASQISRKHILGDARPRRLVQWRHAAYLVLREVMPRASQQRCAHIMHRDHSTMLHAERKHAADPTLLADKIKAIKEVFA